MKRFTYHVRFPVGDFQSNRIQFTIHNKRVCSTLSLCVFRFFLSEHLFFFLFLGSFISICLVCSFVVIIVFLRLHSNLTQQFNGTVKRNSWNCFHFLAFVIVLIWLRRFHGCQLLLLYLLPLSRDAQVKSRVCSHWYLWISFSVVFGVRAQKSNNYSIDNDYYRWNVLFHMMGKNTRLFLLNARQFHANKTHCTSNRFCIFSNLFFIFVLFYFAFSNRYLLNTHLQFFTFCLTWKTIHKATFPLLHSTATLLIRVSCSLGKVNDI